MQLKTQAASSAPPVTTAPSPETVDDVHGLMFELLGSAQSATIPTAVDHAYEMIWRLLIQGERKAGERLADTELAAQLGLSRTPVRQALHRLAQEELVRFDARRGFSVRAFDAADVHEIYDVRRSLEVLALRLAAPHLSVDVLAAHRERLRVARRALQAPRDAHAIIAHLRADLELHDLLIQGSRNGRLIRILASLRGQQMLFQYWDTSYPDANEAASEEHERILVALMDGDTEQAAEAMAEHITAAKNRVLTDLFNAVAPAQHEERSTSP